MVQGWVADLIVGFAENGSRLKSAKVYRKTVVLGL